MTHLRLCLLIIIAAFVVTYTIVGLVLGLVWAWDKIFKR